MSWGDILRGGGGGGGGGGERGTIMPMYNAVLYLIIVATCS